MTRLADDWPDPLPRKGTDGGLEVVSQRSLDGVESDGKRGRLYVHLPVGYRLRLGTAVVGTDEYGRAIHVVYVVGPKPRPRARA